MKLTVQEICERIWRLEEEFDLLHKDIQGVKFWQVLRMGIYYEIAQKTGVFGKPHTRQGSLLKRIKIIPEFLYSCCNSPFKGENTPPNWVFDHPRKKLVHGHYIDIYTHYLIEKLNKDNVLVLEKAYLNQHLTEKEKNRKHTEYIQLLAFLKELLCKTKLSPSDIDFLKQLESAISMTFNIKINLIKKATTSIRRFKSRFEIYNRIFKEKKPEKIFIVVSYLNAPIIAAAKNNQIPTIEIQHGTISPYHLGYSFPACTRELEYFPDFFYSFGEYWTQSVKLPIAQEKISVYGFPYFAELKKEYRAITKKPKQLLFLSQGVIGKELSQFAYKTAIELKDYHIVYKLHPGEYDRWAKEYEALKCAQQLKNFTIVDNDSVNLYQYLAESKYQVGVFSTAIYEGIAFKCKTILVDLPGIEYMKDLVDGNIIPKVHTVEELKESLQQDEFREIDPNYFFAEIKK